jgi:predicted Zn-dependent protease with MMP-like domain
MEVRGMEKKQKYVNILTDALDFLPTKVAEIMDELDAVIEKTSDEKIIKDLNYLWTELDSLKIELVNCAKFFKYFFYRGDQQ